MNIEEVILVFGQPTPIQPNLPTIIKNDNGGATLLILGALSLLGLIIYLEVKRKKERDKEV
jgi:hypothetical protein